MALIKIQYLNGKKFQNLINKLLSTISKSNKNTIQIFFKTALIIFNGGL